MTFPSPSDLIKPWDWNIALELFVWLTVGLIGGGIWLWTRSGRRKKTPDLLGRNVEDFAGIVQEGNGPLPVFLLALYLIVGFVIIAYPAITIIFGYNY